MQVHVLGSGLRHSVPTAADGGAFQETLQYLWQLGGLHCGSVHSTVRGEVILGLPALIHYPGYDEETQTQLFPFRTMAMLISLITLIFVSWWTK